MSDQNYQFAPPPAQGQPVPPVQGQPGQPGQGQPVQGRPAQPRTRYTVPQGQGQQYLQTMQQQAESGLRFCRDCGKPVQPGSAVCVHCNYILDPEAFRQAQRLVGGRSRKPQQPVVQPRVQQAGQRPVQQPAQRSNPWTDPSARRRMQGSSYAQRRSAGASASERRYGYDPDRRATAFGDLLTAVLAHYSDAIDRRSSTERATPPPDWDPMRAAQQARQPVSPGEMSMPSLEPQTRSAQTAQPAPQQTQAAQQAAQQAQAAPPTPEQIAANSPDYHYATRGKVYCPNCGAEVEHGACQCIHCSYVIDERQYQIAMTQAEKRRQLAEDRSAKLDSSDYLKSLLVPGYGKKMYEMNRGRRPQIAEPCRKAAKINSVLLVVLAIIIFMMLGFFGVL